ncbi:MAG: NAD kinase [Chitinophagaceae bacterium]
MHIALYNRAFDSEDIPLFQSLLQGMADRQIIPVFFEDFAVALKQILPLSDNIETFSFKKPLSTRVKFMLSLGGDGTMLDVVTHVGQLDIPILGINLGRLGFLAATQANDWLFALDSLIKGAYILDTRALIHLDSSTPLFGDMPFALNEFSIHRNDSSSLIKIHTYLNGEFLCTYWADGIIVATPTGSTGYSLSCGGPVIFPQADTFVITAVAPHNLNVRPIIVSNSSIISFEIEGRANHYLCSLDARSKTFDNTVSFAVRKEDFEINLIRLEGQNFLHTLQSKLFWGADHRN